MPTRRTLELIVVAGLALRPVFALGKVWSNKTIAAVPETSLLHHVAAIGTVIF